VTTVWSCPHCDGSGSYSCWCGANGGSILEDLKKATERFKPLPASERVAAISVPQFPDLPRPAPGKKYTVAFPVDGEIELRIDATLLLDQHILHFADGSTERVTHTPTEPES